MAQIKGTVLIDSIKAIKARGGESEFQKIVSGLSEESRAIFEQRISPSSWYPVDAFAEFLEADIRETAAGVREALISRAERVIEAQLKGIYRAFHQIRLTDVRGEANCRGACNVLPRN